jgi:single-strand DNA-binding protein
MASYNRVILMGNITRDIELRYTPGGLAVTKVGLAVNDRRKNQAGEWVDETCFVDVTMFGRTAEIAGEYLSKGSPIFVEGKLRYETWEKDGQKHSKLSVVCDRLQFIGAKEGGPSKPRPAGGGFESSPMPQGEESDHDSFHDENIPF